MTILEKMKLRNTYTDTEIVVINYILNHVSILPTMTIGHLAKESYSSNATIIRLCQKLGYDGYKDFKISLLKEVEASKYTVSTIDYSIPFQVEQSKETIINSMFSLYKESITIIHSKLDNQELDDIANCLMNASRIFIFAVGDAKITAMGFMNKLMKINCFPILATEHHDEYGVSKQMNTQDVALFISYSAKNDKFQDCINVIHKKGSKIVTLTANEDSYLNKQSDYSICIPDCENDNKIATFYSQLGFLYVLSIIYALLYNQYQIDQKENK